MGNTILKTYVQLLKKKQFRKIKERLLRRINESALSPFFYYERFFILECGLEDNPVKRKLESIVTRVAKLDDLPQLEKLVDRGDEFKIRMKKGNTCIIAETKGCIVGMHWIEHTKRHYDDATKYFFDLPVDSVWMYDAFVDVKYRLKGVWLNLTSEIFEFLKNKSIKNVFCSVRSNNEVSFNTHIRFGYKVIKRVTYIKCFGKDFYFEKQH